jgi:hypothetical protein
MHEIGSDRMLRHRPDAKQGTAMKMLLLTLGIAVTTAGIATRAHAQNYPWCAEYGGPMGGSSNCGFTTFAQCMDTVRGIGGFCNPNTQYVPPPGSHPAGAARKPYSRANS